MWCPTSVVRFAWCGSGSILVGRGVIFGRCIGSVFIQYRGDLGCLLMCNSSIDCGILMLIKRHCCLSCGRQIMAGTLSLSKGYFLHTFVSFTGLMVFNLGFMTCYMTVSSRNYYIIGLYIFLQIVVFEKFCK